MDFVDVAGQEKDNTSTYYKRGGNLKFVDMLGNNKNKSTKFSKESKTQIWYINDKKLCTIRKCCFSEHNAQLLNEKKTLPWFLVVSWCFYYCSNCSQRNERNTMTFPFYTYRITIKRKCHCISLFTVIPVTLFLEEE